MTREEKLSTIRIAIQTDSNLIILLKLLISANITNIEDTRLDLLLQTLGLPYGEN